MRSLSPQPTTIHATAVAGAKGNSWVPGRGGSYFKSVILEHMLWIKFMHTSCKFDLRLIQKNTFNKKSTLVQVMAWCRQATSHYLSQC